MSITLSPRLRSMIMTSFITGAGFGLAACDGSAPAPVDPATVAMPGPAEVPAVGVSCPTRGQLESPTMPQAVAPPAGSLLFLRVYAEGTQKYACQAGANGAAWTFVAPEAKLYDDRCVLVGSHFAGPTWKFDKDGSAVVGKKAGEAPSPTSGSIPWLLLATNMTTGTGTAASVTYVNRIDTVAGVPPSEGCDSASLGKEIAVPYTATYLFYRNQAAATSATTTPASGNSSYPY